MEPVRERRWSFARPDEKLVDDLFRSCSLPRLIAELLVNRGISGPETARRFLQADLADLHDPFLLNGMADAVDRLCRAILHRERVCVYGDYDVDGITSVAVLIGFFREIGHDCFYYIPHRLDEGYGLGTAGIREAAGKGARVIITVDCGITAFEEADLCSSLGIDLIITDHHTPAERVPSAHAVVNPLLPGCRFPCKHLAGVGVAMNLIIALRCRLREQGFFTECREPNLREYLDLVALGTIADLVPLMDENRMLASYGLRELSTGSRVGVSALKQVAGITGEVDCGAVGFRLAPRLNAAGRLEDAALGVELLLTSDQGRAKELAEALDSSNEERQSLEQSILHDALEMVKNDPSLRNRKSIVLASESWHSGVIGIVASRIVDLYHRPTILIALQEGNGKGSGRSIPGFHLYDALHACSGHLIRFGGHTCAAGLTIDEKTLESFVARFDEVAAGLLSPEDLLPEIRIDEELEPADVSLELAERITSLEPFGIGNPRPVFALRGVRVKQKSIIKGRHVRMRIDTHGSMYDAIGFHMAERIPEGDLLDIAFSLDINCWNGKKSLQLRLKDVRKAESA